MRSAWIAIGFLLISSSSLAEEKSNTAQRVFQQKSTSVFQVKTSISENASKVSYGSAFVLNSQGLLATNYHVVSTAVQESEKYKTYLMIGERSLPAAILAVDVIHDLALIQVEHQFQEVLEIAKQKPRQGERVFSLGLPKDLNISITEGTYNGRIQSVIYDHIHLSSPINSGMSGGPTLNSRGEVVGVNVSYLRDSQNISFAVPAEYLADLILRSRKEKENDFQLSIQRQLKEAQVVMTKHLLSEQQRATPFSKWKVSYPLEPVKCWTQNEDHEKKFYTSIEHQCSLSHAAFLENNRYTSSFEFGYQSVFSESLNRWRFFFLLNKFYNGMTAQFDYLLKFYFDEKFYTKYDCSESVIKNKSGLGVQVNYCLRGYLNYPDLFEAEVKMYSYESRDAILIKGRLKGFTIENIKKIIESQVEGVQYNAHP